jgi:hypothetical protein
MLSRPARPIRTVHEDDLTLKVAKSLSGFQHFCRTTAGEVKCVAAALPAMGRVVRARPRADTKSRSGCDTAGGRFGSPWW